MRKVAGTLVWAVVLLAAVGRLFAQDYRTFADEYTDISSRKLIHVGPLRLVPAFHLSNVGYDNNVLYSPRETAAVSDYTATLSPEVKGYVLVGKSIMLTAVENPEYLFYAKEKGLRTLTNSISPGIRLLVLRSLAVSADYHFRQHTRRAYSEFGMPITDTQKGVDGHVLFETARDSAIGFSGSLDDYRYSDPAAPDLSSYYADTLDRRERALDFEFYYRIFTQSVFFTKAGYEDYTFVHDVSAWRDATSYQGVAGIRFPLTGRAKGMISLGYKRFVPKAEGKQTFSGLVADTDFSLRFGRLGIALGYVRDNFFSYYETAYYYIEDRFKGGLSFYLLPFLRLEGTVQSGAWNYPDPQTVFFNGTSVVVDRRRDRNSIASLGLAVRITGTTGLGVSYNLYRRRSNAPGFDIDRNFLGAYITYDF